MTPRLARRGKLVTASGLLFLFVGALYSHRGAAPIAGLGVVILSGLLTAYLAFFPAAIMLRRRKVEMSWWVPPGDQPGGALAVDRPFNLHIALRNHGPRRLRVLTLDIHATSSLELPDDLEALVPAGQQVQITGAICARATGYQVLHGVVLGLGDILGLFELRAFFPNPIAIKVFPREAAARGAAMRPRGGALHERMGPHTSPRRGLAGELREIRDHQHGDPFKYIAWKATARRQKLMVRELESEIVVTHQYLLDIGGSMRGGQPGHSKLDYSIELITALAKSALEGGDRAGLVTFDSRVYSRLKPGDGHHHYLKLIDRLLETHNVVDEDLTDLTNSELVLAVARYLAHQEAVDVRLRVAPPLDDPTWQRIQAGPSGELFDVHAMDRVVSALLKAMGKTAARNSMAPAWWWSRVHITSDSEPQMAKLRLFCRLRGIELPYRREHEFGRRAQGLAEAIARATTGPRADAIVVVSDLSGLLQDPQATLSALVRGRRAGQLLAVVCPFGPAFLPMASSDIGTLVADTFARHERDQMERARRLLAGRGIPVLEVGPGDSIDLILSRMTRARRAMRRAA